LAKETLRKPSGDAREKVPNPFPSVTGPGGRRKREVKKTRRGVPVGRQQERTPWDLVLPEGHFLVLDQFAFRIQHPVAGSLEDGLRIARSRRRGVVDVGDYVDEILGGDRDGERMNVQLADWAVSLLKLLFRIARHHDSEFAGNRSERLKTQLRVLCESRKSD
jgi:hypothetical protein